MERAININIYYCKGVKKSILERHITSGGGGAIIKWAEQATIWVFFYVQIDVKK